MHFVDYMQKFSDSDILTNRTVRVVTSVAKIVRQIVVDGVCFPGAKEINL